MEESKLKVYSILLLHALVGWMICGASMGIGMSLMSIQAALIVHAILAPVAFALLSFIYFRKWGYTTPLQTAVIFVAFIIIMDVLIVVPFIEKSFEMFTSILGTWFPFLLIFMATYITGSLVRRKL